MAVIVGRTLPIVELSGSGPPSSWRCIMCGAINRRPRFLAPDREGNRCPSCGSVTRLRHIALALLGALADPTGTRSDQPRVAGISDAPEFSPWAASVCDYSGFQFHEEPILDVTDVPGELVGAFDVITCSEVLEHVPPPVGRGFRGVAHLLAPGGRLILTVPCRDEGGVEHWPALVRGELVTLPNESIVLDEHRADGSVHRHHDLVWHGGLGSTLEYRMFDRAWLRRELTDAGFVDIT